MARPAIPIPGHCSRRCPSPTRRAAAPEWCCPATSRAPSTRRRGAPSTRAARRRWRSAARPIRRPGTSAPAAARTGSTAISPRLAPVAWVKGRAASGRRAEAAHARRWRGLPASGQVVLCWRRPCRFPPRPPIQRLAARRIDLPRRAPMPRLPLRYLAGCAAIVLLYLGSARLGHLLGANSSGVSPFWTHSGLALGVLLRGGLRFSPAVLVADMASSAIAGHPLAEILSGGVAETLEAVVGALLLRRLG